MEEILSLKPHVQKVEISLDSDKLYAVTVWATLGDSGLRPITRYALILDNAVLSAKAAIVHEINRL